MAAVGNRVVMPDVLTVFRESVCMNHVELATTVSGRFAAACSAATTGDRTSGCGLVPRAACECGSVDFERQRVAGLVGENYGQ